MGEEIDMVVATTTNKSVQTHSAKKRTMRAEALRILRLAAKKPYTSRRRARPYG